MDTQYVTRATMLIVVNNWLAEIADSMTNIRSNSQYCVSNSWLDSTGSVTCLFVSGKTLKQASAARNSSIVIDWIYKNEYNANFTLLERAYKHAINYGKNYSKVY